MIRPASAFEIIPRGTALSAKRSAYARSRSRARASSSAPTRLAARAKASAFTRALFHVKRYSQRQARTRAPRREGYERSAEPWARERSDAELTFHVKHAGGGRIETAERVAPVRSVPQRTPRRSSDSRGTVKKWTQRERHE